MFAKKLITISALLLIFSALNINAQKNNNRNGRGQNNGKNGDPNGPPPSGVIAIMSLCLNCSKAQNAINAAKPCITNAGAGDAVTAAAAARPGQQCFKKLADMSETVEPKINYNKLNKCGDTLRKRASDEVLEQCFQANRPVTSTGGSRGAKNLNKQLKKRNKRN